MPFSNLHLYKLKNVLLKNVPNLAISHLNEEKNKI